MPNAKLVSVCPVCQSGNIVQDIRYGYSLNMAYGSGCHCGDCGVKLIFNSIHLKQELDKMKKLMKESKEE